jgi:hypothetical protein
MDGVSSSTVLRAGVGTLVFVVTAALLFPLVAHGPQDADSSEFVAVALRGSVAHPPGFPWFQTLLQGLVVLFPENPYWTLALFNAGAQAVAAGLLAYVAADLAADVVVGALLACAWVIWKPTLYTGTMVEAFAVHHVMCALLVLACRAAGRTPTLPGYFLVGLLSGLGGSHHPAIIFFAPWVFAAVWGAPKERTATALATRSAFVLVGAALGLLPYGLLTLQFLHAPNYAFGHIEDLADVVRHALRMDYGVFHMNQHGNEGQPSAFRSFLRATTTAPLVSGVIVLFAMRSRKSANPRADDDGATARLESLDWRIPALGAWIALLIFAAMLRGVDGGPGLALRFFPTIALGASVAAAVALAGVRRWLARLMTASALIVGGVGLGSGLRAADAAGDDYKAELLAQIFESLPQGAFLLLGDDALVFGAEAEQARGVRPDVTVIALGRLDAWWTRERLIARHPFLGALDVEATSWFEPFVTTTLSAGRVIATSPSQPQPAGIRAIARGPLAQWTRATPGTADDDGLLSRCRALPYSLLRLSSERDTSWNLARAFSLQGLARRAERPDEMGKILSTALQRFADGDVAGARQTCAAVERKPSAT